MQRLRSQASIENKHKAPSIVTETLIRHFGRLYHNTHHRYVVTGFCVISAAKASQSYRTSGSEPNRHSANHVNSDIELPFPQMVLPSTWLSTVTGNRHRFASLLNPAGLRSDFDHQLRSLWVENGVHQGLHSVLEWHGMAGIDGSKKAIQKGPLYLQPSFRSVLAPSAPLLSKVDLSRTKRWKQVKMMH